ncbi:DUF2971 domain-containing protein [Marinomonas sp. 2405UD66-6]|uniref:DUF2971 domain-containing protein n=1 Tax=Marinomonas sp. 2405UD66-6 TaxID=3391834 RepID=UPI0039C8CC60
MKLYKYYPPKSKEFILLKSGDISFRFSQKEALNDPFELTPVIEEYPQELITAMDKKLDEMEVEPLAKILIHDLILPDIAQDFCDSSQKLSAHLFGILSFSRKKDHRSLWAYYGENHTGFMVCIDHKSIEIPKEKGIDFFNASRFDKVIYTHKRPKNRSDIFNTFFVKDNSWKHESEYRWIAPLKSFPKKDSLDAKKLDIHTFTLSREKVKGIYLGANASADTISYIEKWANSHNPIIKLYQAVPCQSDFKFNYTPV